MFKKGQNLLCNSCQREEWEKWERSSPVDMKVGEEGGGKCVPGAGTEIHCPAVHGEDHGEAGCHPEAYVSQQISTLQSMESPTAEQVEMSEGSCILWKVHVRAGRLSGGNCGLWRTHTGEVSS